MFVSIPLVKQHLNIDEYYHDDDEYLSHLILVAEKVVEKHIDCDFSVLLDEVGMIPSPLLHAILLFIGNMYQSRESVSFSSATELPLSFRYLLDLYMDYGCNENRKHPKHNSKPAHKDEIPSHIMRPSMNGTHHKNIDEV